MTKKTHIECDGCGETEVVAQGSAPVQIKEGVTVSLNGGANKHYDLCFMCEKTLTNYTDPTRWPRAIAAGEE